MGRLQDKQYASPKKKEKTAAHFGKEKLQALFCPPLDTTLVEVIWNDSLDYNSSFQILKDLAKEADIALNEEQAQRAATCSKDALPAVSVSSHSTYSSDHDDQDSGQSEDEVASDGVSTNVGFLIKCFPNHDSQVRAILKAQGNDVEKATDILLNSVFLENEYSDDSRDTSSAEDASRTKRKQKKQQQKKNVILTLGQLHNGLNGYTNDSRDSCYANDLATVPFNYWHQYDEKVDRIQPIFPTVRRNVIHQCVQSSRGNEIAAVGKIMEKEPTAHPVIEKNWRDVKELDQLQVGLSAALIDRTKLQIRRIAVGVIVCTDKRQSVAQMVQEGVNFALTYEAQQKARAKRLESNLESDASAAVQDMPMIPDYLKARAGEGLARDDPEECRAMALELLLERNELFRRAAASHQQAKNKTGGEGGVAFYYAEEARKLDSKARELNMRAAKAFVKEKQLQHDDEYLLDLHGLTVAEAQVVIREGVTQWWSRSQMQQQRRRLQSLKIITGVGKHSAYGISKLLPSALKLLKREGWKFDQPYPGCIHVHGIAR